MTLEEKFITDPDEIAKITGIGGIKQIKMDEIRGENEWQVVNRNIASDRFGRVAYIDDVIYLPTGEKKTQAGFIAKPGASVLPIDDRPHLYFASVYAYHGMFQALYAAGGAVKKGESFEETARRETEEELGMKFERLIDLGEILPIPGVINCPQHLYVAVGRLNIGTQKLGATEKKLKRVDMPLEQAYKIAMDPKQRTFDLQTGWAVLKVQNLYREGKLF